MANTFKLELVTPLAKILTTEANFVMLRTTEGDMGILPNHSPFVAGLSTGEMKIKNKDEEIFYYISGGFIEISENVVTILADEAMNTKEINPTKVREELESIENRLKTETDEIEIENLKLLQHQAITKLRIVEEK